MNRDKLCLVRCFRGGKKDVMGGNLFRPGAGAQKLYAIDTTIAHKKYVLLAKILQMGTDTAPQVLEVSPSLHLQTEVSILL
jgi:hypothetical protein